MIAAAASVEDVREIVRGAEPGTRLLPVAGATKPALSTSTRGEVESLDVSGLSGVIQYDPGELTLTARAGTPVSELAAALAENGQYLPFDPPLADAGATLGGVVAAGASGSNAFRHGGVRNFVIGVELVDGTGRLIRGGGRVVKNAAGFDLPKLMVGSAGRLGVIAALSLKVFPRPPATTTLALGFGSTASSLAALTALARGPVGLDALDLLPGGELLVRLGGPADTIDGRAQRLIDALAGRERPLSDGRDGPLALPGLAAPVERLDGDAEQALWRAAASLEWAPADAAIVRAAVSVRAIGALEAGLGGVPGSRLRVSLGGQVAWIACAPDGLPELDRILARLELPADVLIGPPDRPRLGPVTGGPFAARVARAIDPHSRFLELS